MDDVIDDSDTNIRSIGGMTPTGNKSGEDEEATELDDTPEPHGRAMDDAAAATAALTCDPDLFPPSVTPVARKLGGGVHQGDFVIIGSEENAEEVVLNRLASIDLENVEEYYQDSQHYQLWQTSTL